MVRYMASGACTKSLYGYVNGYSDLAGSVGACRSVIGFWAAQWLVVRGRERARKGVLSPSVCASLAS